MIVYCCPKCKMVDIGNDNEQKNCFRCGIPMLSLGIPSSEWNKYNSDQMSEAVDKCIGEYNNSSFNNEEPITPLDNIDSEKNEQEDNSTKHQDEEPIIQKQKDNSLLEITAESPKKLRALKCEMCDSNDLIKQDGLFVCQNCGTKYSVEEARKMIAGTVDIKGTVKVDTSNELKNLYDLARRARSENNSEHAQKYYSEIIVKDPSSWEAYFYNTYYQSMNCKIGEICSAAIRINNCEQTVFNLIKENVSDSDAQKEAVIEVKDNLIHISRMLFQAYKDYYYGTGESIRNRYTYDYRQTSIACRDIVYYAGDLIESYWGEAYGDIAASCWRFGIAIQDAYNWYTDNDKMKAYYEKIKKYDSSYKLPDPPKPKGACYVATAVYGSYDCPEVWTLRRYRDHHLSSSWYGRAFIHTYYAVSPTLVKWFGHTGWFRKIVKKKLDKIIITLHEKGYESTPYEDQNW